MRARSLREGFLACAGLAVVLACPSGVGARAATDLAAMESTNVPFAADAISVEPDLTAIDAADWKPDHAATVQTAAITGIDDMAKPTKAAEKPVSDKGADASDPEPDGVVIPATPSPSHDPLDRPKPAAAAPTTGDAAKTEKKAEEPLPALNAAIKAALDKRDASAVKGQNAVELRKEREAIAFFYAAHGFAPAWSDDGKASDAVASILTRLGAADEDALSLPATPTELKSTGTPDEVAASDLALTEAVVAYARQATGSRIQPRSISPLIGAKPDLADPAEVLDALRTAGSEAGDKLHALNPVDPRYAALRDKLGELHGNKAPKVETTIDTGPTLTVGMTDSRVPLLRERLKLEAKADGDESELVYDAALAAAVAKFQRAHGLKASGAVGNPTVAALNGGKVATNPSRLEGTLVANMEMWRWLPRDLGTDRIEVNIPDYIVKIYHDNQVVGTNRVVVGKTDTPTPIFSNTMKFLIVNPVWNVPQSIIQNEFGGGTHGFKARYVHGKLYLQQPAGPGNALGRIKFMFPNEYSVYLHDTPAKHLFGNAKRAYSHGCVRVDKPFEFAESVLNDGVPEGGKILWSQQRLQKMLGTTERYVDLPKPLPIHIQYFTATVDESGQVATREDIYGYTGAVAAALGKATPGAVPVAGTKPVKPKNRVASDSDEGPYGDRPRHSRRHSRRLEREQAEAYAPPAETSAGRGSFSNPFGFIPF